jgi:hypothetical protein
MRDYNYEGDDDARERDGTGGWTAWGRTNGGDWRAISVAWPTEAEADRVAMDWLYEIDRHPRRYARDGVAERAVAVRRTGDGPPPGYLGDMGLEIVVQ